MAQRAPRRIAVEPGDQGQSDVLAALQLPQQTTTLVVNGETGDAPEFPADQVAAVLRAIVSDLADRPGPVIISGGTCAGVFALLGDVVAELSFTGPVVGVVPAGKINRPEGTPLEPHHTDVLMVDGDSWGDETPTMLALCRALGQRGPVVALIAGGGKQTMVEVDGHQADGRRTVVLSGTGRTADEVARRGQAPVNLRIVDVTDPRAVVYAALSP